MIPSPAVSPVASGTVEDPLRGRDFRLLVAASALSSLGDELALIALTIKVANLTDSGWAVAALLLAGLLPLVIFAPAAGVIVDNYETTRTLSVASGFQAAAALGLAFASGLPGILLLAFLLGSATAVATPALYTLVPAVVGDEHATAANAYLETARYGGMIAGPLLAGLFSAIPRVGSEVALLVDGATFVVIAASALALTVRRRPMGAVEEGSKGEAKAGFGVIGRDGLLVVTFTVFGAVILFAAMDNVAEVFFATDTLNAGGWGYGLLASAWIVGLVLGAAMIARKLPNARLVPALLVASVVLGLAVGALGRDRRADPGDRALRGGRRGERRAERVHAEPDRAPRGGPIPRTRLRRLRRLGQRHAIARDRPRRRPGGAHERTDRPHRRRVRLRRRRAHRAGVVPVAPRRRPGDAGACCTRLRGDGVLRRRCRDAAPGVRARGLRGLRRPSLAAHRRRSAARSVGVVPTGFEPVSPP